MSETVAAGCGPKHKGHIRKRWPFALNLGRYATSPVDPPMRLCRARCAHKAFKLEGAHRREALRNGEQDQRYVERAIRERTPRPLMLYRKRGRRRQARINGDTKLVIRHLAETGRCLSRAHREIRAE